MTQRYVKEIVPEDADQLPEFLERELRRIEDLQDQFFTKDESLENFVFAAYGGLHMATPPVSAPDIPTASFVKVTAFDSGRVTDPKYILQDVVNDQLQVEIPGKWYFSFYAGLEHDRHAQGEQFELRLWDSDNSLQLGNTVVIAVAHNTAVTNVAIGVIVEISEALTNTAIEVQFGNSSTLISDVEFDTLNWSLHYISEFTNGAVLAAVQM